MEQDFRMEEFDKAVLNETATWWQMSLPSGEVLFGTAKAKMLGFPDDMFKTYHDFVELVHPEDKEKTMQAMKDHLEGRSKIYEAVYRIKNKNGEYLKFYDCGQIIRKEGDQVTVMGFVLKVADDADAFQQMKKFKELILGGKPIHYRTGRQDTIKPKKAPIEGFLVY